MWKCKRRHFSGTALIVVVMFFATMTQQCGKKEGTKMISDEFAVKVADKMIAKFGETSADRVRTGITQMQKFWTKKDGSEEDFQKFCMENFLVEGDSLNRSFVRLENSLETLKGVMLELERDFQWDLQVDVGPIMPVNYLMANFSLSPNVNENLFKSKVAFWVLLNFKIYPLDEMLRVSDDWTREKWAQARLAQRFNSRVSSEISQKTYEAYVAADNYISSYNICMGHLLTENGEKLFPEDLTLITHWGIRDELKAQYPEVGGLERQKMIYDVMQKIITQEIPASVINNPKVDWKVESNQVIGAEASPEPNTRYQQLLNIFHAEKNADPYYPINPTFVDRKFNEEREIPEETIKALFVQLLKSDELKETAAVVKKRLGREFEPFDIWYNGFKSEDAYSQAELDKIVSVRYPTADVFHEKLPETLMKLGFDKQTAEFLKTKINVDPARGSGHAQGAERPSDNAHLRTRVQPTGMDYKGFNIALHELGHCVEQVFSLNRIDHPMLSGVPNTAFTEAFAFVFQKRDMEVLGLTKKDPDAEYLDALNQIWSAAEISAVALVDMQVWRWMYEHPKAKPEELKAAVIDIAKATWNEYYYPILGHKDAIILAVYSHMIDAGLYLPDYPIGHIIQFQIEQYISGKNLGKEMERMCTLGSITPSAWMKAAVGTEISVQPMLDAARSALTVLQ